MDGRWSRGLELVEEIQQGHLNRMRILTVNTIDGTLSNFDASDSAGLDPNAITDEMGGPHFVLSPETPDGSKTLGFGWALLENLGVAAGSRAVAAVGGFTVTTWRLVEATMLESVGSGTIPRWTDFEPETGVVYNNLFRTFDANTFPLRFQIGNLSQGGTLHIAMVEL